MNAPDGSDTSALLVDRIYQGGRRGNASDDPLPRLIGVGNQGELRYIGTRLQSSLLARIRIKRPGFSRTSATTGRQATNCRKTAVRNGGKQLISSDGKMPVHLHEPPQN